MGQPVDSELAPLETAVRGPAFAKFRRGRLTCLPRSTVDLGLGLAGRYFIEGGGQTFLFDLFDEDVFGHLSEDLFLKPVGIAVDFPFAKVLLVDRPAAGGQPGLRGGY